MGISCQFLMNFMLILVFLFIECQGGIVLKNFKSRRTLMAELEKEAAEEKARFDSNTTIAINIAKDHIKPSHTTGNCNKPSNQISPRMKDETKNSKKPKAKGSLKFKNVTEINKSEGERKLSEHSNEIQTSKLNNLTKELEFPKDKTFAKGTNKSKISAEHQVGQKVISKTNRGKSTKHQNNLKVANAIAIMDLNITKTVNRTLNKGANSLISTLVHVTNAKPNVTEAVHLNVSALKSNITEVIHLNVTMAVKPNATETAQFNVTMAMELNVTKNKLPNDTIAINPSIDHLNITKTGKSNVTEVLHLNITEAIKTSNTAVKNVNLTMALKPNVTEILHLNITKSVRPNVEKTVHPNDSEVMHLNVKISIKPNVTVAVKPNSTKVMNLNVTEAVKSTVTELKNSNVIKGVSKNLKPELNTTKVNLKRKMTTSFDNSKKEKDSQGANSTRHVNDHLQNVQSISSGLNSATLNEAVNKTKPSVNILNIPLSSNRSNLKEVLPVVNNSVNLHALSIQSFNSSQTNSTSWVNRSISEVNKANSSLLRTPSLISQESMLNKTSGILVEGINLLNGTDLSSVNPESLLIHTDQKSVSHSEELSLKLDNTEELKIKSNGTDQDKIRENTNFLVTLPTTNSSDEVANLNGNISKLSSENLNVSADPIFNFSFPLPLEAISNSTIFESIINLSKIILTDEIKPESLFIIEKPGETLNKSLDAFHINESDIVDHTQNKTNKQDIFNLNEKVDKNKNDSKLNKLMKMDNKSKGIESEMVTMILLPEESNATQSDSGLDFLVNSEVAKNAVLAMDVFNLSDTSLTDHVIEDSDIHSFIDLMMPAVSESLDEASKPKHSNGTERFNSSAQRTTEVETFLLNVTSETTDEINESVVEYVNMLSNDSQFQPIEIDTTNSTEVIEVLKCPPPGLCLFWFAARDTCSHHNQCPASQLCCRVRCSKHCIDVEPQHD